MCKRTLSISFVITALLLTVGYSVIAIAADGTGTANATIVAPINIVENTQMNFGSVGPDATSATTVVLTPAGGISSADGAGLFGGHASGVFDVTGAANQTYSITLPAGAVNLTGPGTMSVDTWTNTTGSGTATLSAGGADTINVGATLNVGANQAAGAYAGNYTVTVNYN